MKKFIKKNKENIFGMFLATITAMMAITFVLVMLNAFIGQ